MKGNNEYLALVSLLMSEGMLQDEAEETAYSEMEAMI